MTIPYTYLITNKTTGLKYYGVRTAKDCFPEDLWKQYFTSSKKVHELINKYGKEDWVIEIRRIFTSPDKAIIWEGKILKKIYNNDDYLNRNWNGLPSVAAMQEGGRKGAAITNAKIRANRPVNYVPRKPGQSLKTPPYPKGVDGRKIRAKRFWYSNGKEESQFPLNGGPKNWYRGRIRYNTPIITN